MRRSRGTCREGRQSHLFYELTLHLGKRVAPLSLSPGSVLWSNLAESLIQVHLRTLTTTLGAPLKPKQITLPSRSQLSMLFPELSHVLSNPGSQGFDTVESQLPMATKSHCFNSNFTWIGLEGWKSRRGQDQVALCLMRSLNNHHALDAGDSSTFLRAFQYHLIIS